MSVSSIHSPTSLDSIALTNPVSTATPNLPTDHSPDINTPADASIKSRIERIGSKAKKLFADFEALVWPFLSETRKLCKHILKAVTVGAPHLKGRLDPIISRIGVISLISLLLTIKNIPSDFAAIIKNFKLKDVEGTTLSFLGFIINQVDGIDSLMTAWTAFESFGVLPTVTAFSLIALPIAFGLLGYSSIINTYKSVWN